MKNIKQSKSATIFLREDGIIQINIKNDIIISKNDVMEIVDCIEEVSQQKKYPVLILAGDYTLPESEARPYIASAEANRYTICNAFVINGVAQKLMANVFMKIDRPATPTKFFNTENEALNWLKTFL